MKTTILAISGCIALALPAAAMAQTLPTTGVISGSTSSASSGSGAHSFGLGSATTFSMAGNAATGGAMATNGTMTANPNLQINSVETYSSSIGGTAGGAQTTGFGAGGAGGTQTGSGFGAGVSYVPSFPAP